VYGRVCGPNPIEIYCSLSGVRASFAFLRPRLTGYRYHFLLEQYAVDTTPCYTYEELGDGRYLRHVCDH
jgi:hypothetical protein